jgi:glycerol-3-phosphate dehydrogenase (NAD(P)+)
MSKKILVIGSGTWGTAIADLLARNGNEVFLSGIEPDVTAEINSKNTNQKYLPQIILSPQIKAIEGFSHIIPLVDFVFIVTPSSVSAKIFAEISRSKRKKDCGFVICSKGVEPKSLNLLGDAFIKISGVKKYAVLSGPNFAIEVAQQIPSITTIASKDKNLAKKVIAVLDNKNFKAFHFKDPRTAEICGIVKNIMAIGCGIIDGLGLGVNTKSALIVKGASEIQILCKKLKASEDLEHAAGFGDIFLTCSSTKSRNNSLGVLLAQGKSYAEISKNSRTTYEGAASAQTISAMAKKLKLRLDLCETINEILSKNFSVSEIKNKIVKAILK